jgi:hypothetical protein
MSDAPYACIRGKFADGIGHDFEKLGRLDHEKREIARNTRKGI